MRKENEDIISFQSGVINNGEYTAGKIVVHDRARVESEVLPKYFNHSSFASLRRQLNYFAFVRIGKSRQRGAIYSNESVINLKDILRLKRRAVGGNSTMPESNGTKSKNLENSSIASHSTVNLQVTPKLSTTKAGSFMNNVEFDITFPSNITLIRSSQSAEETKDVNSKKRLFSSKLKDHVSDVSPPIHLPLRKKIKFSYESSVANRNDIQDSQSHFTPGIGNAITENSYNHTVQSHREVGVIVDSSIYPTRDDTLIPQQTPEYYHFENKLSHEALPNFLQSKHPFIKPTNDDTLSKFGTHYQRSNLKDDEILAGCNALLALNCNSSGASYIRAGTYLSTQ